MWTGRSKGKGRETPAIPFNLRAASPEKNLERRFETEGNGASEGVVLPLQCVGDDLLDISYTLPVLVGVDSPQNLSLQVDTGSADMWIASTSCGSCKGTPQYDPTNANLTGANFHIDYLVGEVDGPVVWDSVTVGGYSIGSQALAAANVVNSEPLSQFSGVLGLALPGDSIIAGELHPQVGDTPDGATWASNLFSITPVSSAPALPFLSIALERPGSDAIPSILGIGRHPAALVPDPSRIVYDTPYESGAGLQFWKASVRGITVYTNSSRMPITLGLGASSAFPTAVLDTGASLIYTTTDVANAIYGAIGVDPASDGNYYLPCTTPLNMTITLDNRQEIPLHPLDLSAKPGANSPYPNSCIGAIQTSADATLRNPKLAPGDMILGVPFMRNVYTVLAYSPPLLNGTFPATPLNSDAAIRPRLGLMSLTDPTTAMDEFHRVRVLNQPLGNSSSNFGAASISPHKKNVGVDVLIALAAFVGLCALLFTLRWLLVRWKLQRKAKGGLQREESFSSRDRKTRDVAHALGGYQLAPRARRGRERAFGIPDDGLPSEDELRQIRFERYMQSLHTVSTDRTHVDGGGVAEDGAYFNFKDKPEDGSGAVVGKDVDADGVLVHVPPVTEPLLLSPYDQSPLLPEHSPEARRHSRTLSQNLPLLPNEDEEEFPRTSMAGIGAAGARYSASFSARPDFPHRTSMTPTSHNLGSES